MTAAALDQLLAGSFFDICKVRAIADALDVPTNSRAMDMLRPLHCIHYNQMPAETRELIPQLVAEALSPPARSSVVRDAMMANIDFEEHGE